MRDITKIGLFGLTAMAGGCSHLYTLPDPPPKEEWVVAEAKAENPEEVAARAIASKKAAIQCYAALASKNWEKALEYMSVATVRAFDEASSGDGRLSVFEKGEATIQGEKRAFDPVGDVFITGLSDIRDEFPGRTDEENASRHVYYAVDASGKAHEIVLILEEDKWVVDRPEIFTPLLTP